MVPRLPQHTYQASGFTSPRKERLHFAHPNYAQCVRACMCVCACACAHLFTFLPLCLVVLMLPALSTADDDITVDSIAMFPVLVYMYVHSHVLSHYPLDPSQLPLESATGHLPVLRQPRPLQMQRHSSAQEQGELNIPTCTIVLCASPYPSMPLYCAIERGRVWSDSTGCVWQTNQIVGAGVCD